MRTIKKIDPKSVANLYAFFTAIIGFFYGIALAVANIINVYFFEGYAGVGEFITASILYLVVGCLVGLISALVGAFVGYITGYIFARLYNYAVKIRFVGGIKIDLD
ncbi:MAG: hypothetical protein Q8Q23_02880 [bacterium]|nr:hypothetical protein [bacterium]